MRDVAGLRPGLRCLRELLRRNRLIRPETRSRAARAVLAWAVLAGLFFMHGAPVSAGCPDGAPMVTATATATPALPAAVPGGPVTGAPRLTAAWLPAVSAKVGARPSVLPDLRATAAERGSCCAGLCSSRQPRQGSGGASAASPASAIQPSSTAVLPVRCLTTAPRAARPPGRPGLPLPLFLGISRT